MADKTHIEWTDATWNPITGCSVVSPGCTNCYAMKLAGTRLQHHPSRVGLTVGSKTGPVWNGKVRRNREWLAQPLEWKKPRMVFVCAHGDLFHEDVPDDWILDVFTVMAIASRHTFQILTKRADRMRDFSLVVMICSKRFMQTGIPSMAALVKSGHGRCRMSGWVYLSKIRSAPMNAFQRCSTRRRQFAGSAPSHYSAQLTSIASRFPA